MGMRKCLHQYLQLLDLLFHSLQVCAHGRHRVQFAFHNIHRVKHVLQRRGNYCHRLYIESSFTRSPNTNVAQMTEKMNKSHT